LELPQALPPSSSSFKQGERARAAPSPHHHLQDLASVALATGKSILSPVPSPLP
jgi:hypothetical protein